MRKRYAFQVAFYDRAKSLKVKGRAKGSMVQAWHAMSARATQMGVELPDDAEELFGQLAADMRRKSWSRSTIEPRSWAYLIELARLIA